LHIAVRGSAHAAVAVTAISLVTTVPIVVAPVGAAGRCLLLVLIGFTLFRALRTVLQPAIRELMLDSYDCWQIGPELEALAPVRLREPVVVLPGLLVLRFTAASRTHTVLLLADNVSPTALRRLQVRLLLR
jgi:hypothetical protein